MNNYAQFLDSLLDEGFIPIGRDTLLGMSNDEISNSKCLFIYHDQDSFHANSFKAFQIECEHGIQSVWTLHVRTDIRYAANRHGAMDQIEKLIRIGATIGWHENILQHREEATPEMVDAEIEEHLQMFVEDYGEFPKIFSGHGDRKRMDACGTYSRTEWVMKACEDRGVPCIDFLRQNGTYTSDVSGDLKEWRSRYDGGTLFINLHSGNYDVDQVFFDYYEKGRR